MKIVLKSLCVIGMFLTSVALAQEEIVNDSYLTTGVHATPVYEHAPCGYEIDWIFWDSGFRFVGLRVGDRVVGINGTNFVCPPQVSETVSQETQTQEVRKFVQYGLGSLNETQIWKSQGLKDGSSVALNILRRSINGDEKLEIRGTLRYERLYFSASGAPMFGLTEPAKYERDGFNKPWAIWYEDFQRFLYRPLHDGWAERMDSRRLLAELLEDQPRMDLLTKKYSGAFSKAVREDFELARKILEGEVYTLSKEDIDYRRLGEQRAQQVTVASQNAWSAMLKTLESQTIAAFPSVNPLENREKVVGKVVVLPPIGQNDWVNEAGRCYLASGDRSQGHYFVDCNTPTMDRMFDAQFRYQRSVKPKLKENYAVIGRILDAPKMLVIDDQTSIGLMLEPLGVMIGDEVFIDLQVNKNKLSPFAGEDSLTSANLNLPPDNASPRQVIETMIQAVKWGDQKLWKSLFAESKVWVENGRIGVSPQESSNRFEDYWVRSRRLILDNVFDVRVALVSTPLVLVTPQMIKSAPTVEKIRVEIRHIGSFDGVYRSFVNSTVHPEWFLQRVNNGPWRITSNQEL